MLYVEIISGLWISDIDMMYNKKFLQDNNITVIINCTIEYTFPSIQGVRNMRIPLTDNLYNNIDTLRPHKDKVLTFIDDSLENHNILLCCYDGKTMSPYIISLYLMKYGGIAKDKIKQIILSKNTAISMDYGLELLDI